MRSEFDTVIEQYGEFFWDSCPACAQPRAFERPPCRDGHGSDCPERVCTACGCALLVDPLAAPRAPSGSDRSGSAATFAAGAA